MPCSNAAKTQNPLKFVGVPQTPEPISAVSGPKFTILSGHVEEVLLRNKFFPIVDNCLSCEDMARQSCAMVPRWRFFASCICRTCRQWSSAVLVRPHHVRLTRPRTDFLSDDDRCLARRLHVQLITSTLHTPQASIPWRSRGPDPHDRASRRFPLKQI